MSAHKVSKRARFAHLAKLRRARWAENKSTQVESLYDLFISGASYVRLTVDKVGPKLEKVAAPSIGLDLTEIQHSCASASRVRARIERGEA